MVLANLTNERWWAEIGHQHMWVYSQGQRRVLCAKIECCLEMSRSNKRLLMMTCTLTCQEQIKQKAIDDDMHSDMPRADQTKGY